MQQEHVETTRKKNKTKKKTKRTESTLQPSLLKNLYGNNNTILYNFVIQSF